MGHNLIFFLYAERYAYGQHGFRLLQHYLKRVCFLGNVSYHLIQPTFALTQAHSCVYRRIKTSRESCFDTIGSKYVIIT